MDSYREIMNMVFGSLFTISIFGIYFVILYIKLSDFYIYNINGLMRKLHCTDYEIRNNEKILEGLNIKKLKSLEKELKIEVEKQNSLN